MQRWVHNEIKAYVVLFVFLVWLIAAKLETLSIFFYDFVIPCNNAHVLFWNCGVCLRIFFFVIIVTSTGQNVEKLNQKQIISCNL